MLWEGLGIGCGHNGFAMTRGLEVPSGQVHLWWASLDVSDSAIDRLCRWLAPAELQRAERFRVTEARRRFIAARAALRLVLGHATETAPEDVVFIYGEHGKPRLEGCRPHFNSSDSGGCVVVALAVAEIGVDIEVVRPLARMDRLARRICTRGELEALSELPPSDGSATLLRLWTYKEAALKAIGTGLPGGVRNVEVSLPPVGRPRLVRLLDESGGWELLSCNLNPDLLCSVVVRGSGYRTVCRPFSLDHRSDRMMK
jgi:4'-phosphopantetheinyl transferase